MPDKDGPSLPGLGSIRKIAASLQSNLDHLYQRINYADPSNARQLSNIKADVNDTIKNIMLTTSDSIGQPNISKIFDRLRLAQNDRSTVSEFERIFGDNEFVSSLTSTYMDNRWIRAIDIEIDEILKYMPKLQEALDTIADNVLSADSFNKDYLNLSNSLPDSHIADEQFSRNIADIKEQYDLLRFVKTIFKQTSKYGECYVYRVPYDRAIQRLMQRKGGIGDVTSIRANESGVLFESSNATKKTIPYAEVGGGTFADYGEFDMKLTVEEGIISSIIEQEQEVRGKLSVLNESSIFSEAQRYDFESRSKAYAYDDTINQSPVEAKGKTPVHKRFDRTIGDHMELPDYNTAASDGLYDPNDDSNKTPMIKGMNGCIVKILKRERVVPIILNEVCLGYYYFEFDSNADMFNERLGSNGMVNTLTGIRSNQRAMAFDTLQRREELLRAISNELAKKIDVKFIDKNQDLKKEIYYILKYNDEFNASLAGGSNSVRVSYIPPDDIRHFYFELDEDTGRGVSDLNLSLIPAKLWVAITICNCLGIMTRGNDKRVYYVRQSVENNVAKTLLKTINEIKKANFGIRQIENINSILNITGRFNDYIIPRGADGNSPIDMEVLPGQQIEIKTDLLSILEESAINQLVPLDLIQQRQGPDYAIQFTMSSSKFLRFVYDRQSDFAKQVSELITDIYDYEYSTKDKITLRLPPPLFINMTNTNQLLDNTRNLCNAIAEFYLAGETDEMKKNLFTKRLILQYLGSYLDTNMLDMVLDKVNQEYEKNKLASGEDDNSGGGY